MRIRSCTKWNRFPDGLGLVVIMIFGVCETEEEKADDEEKRVG